MMKNNGTGKFDLELFFNALADRTRLRLINLMGETEVCVCFFVEVLGTNQPKISRHLAYLKKAGLVTTRREGNWMHYRLADLKNEDVKQILQDVRERLLANDSEMQADRSRLVEVCCQPVLPESVQGAPLPAAFGNVKCKPQC